MENDVSSEQTEEQSVEVSTAPADDKQGMFDAAYVFCAFVTVLAIASLIQKLNIKVPSFLKSAAELPVVEPPNVVTFEVPSEPKVEAPVEAAQPEEPKAEEQKAEEPKSEEPKEEPKAEEPKLLPINEEPAAPAEKSAAKKAKKKAAKKKAKKAK